MINQVSDSNEDLDEDDEIQVEDSEASKAKKCFEALNSGFPSLFSKKRPTEESESTDMIMEDIRENPPPDVSKEEEEEARKVVKRILTFFSSGNEIFWFR